VIKGCSLIWASQGLLNALWYPWFDLRISYADSPPRLPGDPPSSGAITTMAALLFHTLFMTMRREHHHILIDKEVTTQERWTKNGFLHFFSYY
jgi:hypothetical protein